MTTFLQQNLDPGAPLPPREAPLGRGMVKGTGWMILARVSVQVFGFCSTIVLARLLVPADFGLVALATATAAVFSTMADFSFRVALIQNQDATREHYDTVWTLGILRSILIAVILAAFSGLIAEFMGDARLQAIVYCLAILALLNSLSNVAAVDFDKYFQFHKSYILMVANKIGMVAAAIPVAIVWRSYWALIAGIMCGAVVRMVLTYALHSYRPRLSLRRWREIMHFSKWLLLNNLVFLVANRAPTFIIGKIAGASQLGFYTVAYETAHTATDIFLAPMRRVLLPGFSKVSSELESLRNSYLDVFGIALLIGSPIALGLGAVAEPLVHVVLGAQWLSAIPLLQIMAIIAFLPVITAGNSTVYLAMGRPYILAWISTVSNLAMIPLMIWGVSHSGVLGAAWTLIAVRLVSVGLDTLVVKRQLDLKLRSLLYAGWRPLAAAAAMVAAVSALDRTLPTPSSTPEWIFLLLELTATGATVYVASILGLWLASGRPNGAERHAITLIREVWPRLMKAKAAAN